MHFRELEKRFQVHLFDHQLLECDCSSHKYTFDGHDITLIIPNGTVAEGEKVHFEVAVAMYGPFNFPDNTQPISPILWLCLMEESTELKKPFQVILPHCLTGLTKSRLHQQQVCFIKSCHEDRDTEGHYNFSQCSSDDNYFLLDGYGVLETNYFGLFSFAKLKNINQTDLSYCLARVYLPPSPPTYNFHFYALFNLPTHKKVCQLSLIHI